MKKEEILKPILGYEGRYYVSNQGNVYSRCKCHGQTGLRKLKPFRRAKGSYFIVCLSQDGVKKYFDIHVLVAMAFLGKRPRNLVIDHINNCNTDNRVENLRYCPNRENVIKGFIEGRGAQRCHRVRIEADNLEFSFTAYSVREASRQTGVSRRTLERRLARKPVCYDKKRGLTFIRLNPIKG